MTLIGIKGNGKIQIENTIDIKAQAIRFITCKTLGLLNDEIPCDKLYIYIYIYIYRNLDIGLCV
jgi:hypothetical protein